MKECRIETYEQIKHRLFLENIEKNAKTMRYLASIEKKLKSAKYCKRCYEGYFPSVPRSWFCVECRDKLEIVRKAKLKLLGIRKYYKTIPREKQGEVRFLLGIIKEWEANNPTE